ncbi:MAG: diguanylate cyclase [Woeseia sp.]
MQRKVLQQIIEAGGEPLLVARVDQADWPVVMTNPAFDSLSGLDVPLLQVPMTDVIEKLHGRDAAQELSETVRSGQASTIPLEYAQRNWLLVLKPLATDGSAPVRYYAVYWRDSSTNSGSGDSEAHRALLRARRRIRDLSRDDAVTGLLNASAFRDVLSHDWAVAAREQGALALIAFTIDNFDDYIKVFGRHAADSCLRRVAQAVRRCLRRASDVCGRLPNDGKDVMMVLFHASDEASLTEFGDNIAREVRGLGLHHPHSKTSRFVTVSYKTALATAHGGEPEAERFLNSALAD